MAASWLSTASILDYRCLPPPCASTLRSKFCSAISKTSLFVATNRGRSHSFASITRASSPKRASPSKTRRQGVWEDPDDGSGSDYDDNDEEGDESDWEQDGDDVVGLASGVGMSSPDKYEEELVKGISGSLCFFFFLFFFPVSSSSQWGPVDNFSCLICCCRGRTALRTRGKCCSARQSHS